MRLQTRNYQLPTRSGHSLLEIVVAIGIFVLIASNVVVLYLTSLSSNLRDKEKLQADLYLQQGVEAVRSIRDFDFQNLANGTYGISRVNGYWQLSGTSDTQGQFVRTITIADVQRDVACAIVSSGGSVDASSKKITVNIAWTYESASPTSLSVTQYLNRTNNISSCGMAGNLIINTSDAEIDTNQKDLKDIILQNTGSASVVIDKVILSWNNSSVIEQVRINGTFVWRYDIEGTPDGRQASGVELDVENFTISAGGTAEIDRIRFDGNMNGASFVIQFKMSDGTTISAHAL